MNKFIVNGVEYDSLDDLPGELRAVVSQAGALGSGDGRPGVQQVITFGAPGATPFTQVITSGGATYSSLEQLPPELRAKVEAAMGGLSIGTPSYTPAPPAALPHFAAQDTAEPVKPKRWWRRG